MLKFVFLMLVSFSAVADEWSTQDKALETIFVAVTAVDWLQTRNIARHNCTNPDTGLHNCQESGIAAIFIGNQPSVGQVNTYFAAAIISHIAIVNILPSKYRAPFQGSTIAVEFGYAYHNYTIGISGKF